MKIFDTTYQDRRYTVYLDPKTGDAVAYRVRMLTRFGKAVDRLLWSKERHGGPIPPRLAAMLNQRGTSELIAAAMGW